MINIIHLSDMHYKKNRDEQVDVVVKKMFDDIKDNYSGESNLYLAFSGDIVQAGSFAEQFDGFYDLFNEKLNELGIPYHKRICVPGNHDLCQKTVVNEFDEHEGVAHQVSKAEESFNDYLHRKGNKSVFYEKFGNYLSMEERFAKYGVSGVDFTGGGHEIESGIGVYCLNSAVCSTGGLSEEKGNLSINTRLLAKWASECPARHKILIMHHPVSWLSEWARREVVRVVKGHFCLVLSGHEHDQNYFDEISPGGRSLVCSAPPLFTDKKSLSLGYEVIGVCPDRGVVDISYRQWTKHSSFVLGTALSNTDTGKIQVCNNESHKSDEELDSLEKRFEKNLEAAQVIFSSQPFVWVLPVLHTKPIGYREPVEEMSDPEEYSDSGDEKALIDEEISIDHFISKVKSSVVEAPPQFGLTCLSHFLVLRAWQMNKKRWVRVDSDVVKPHSVVRTVKDQMLDFFQPVSIPDCIVVDSWKRDEKNHHHIINKIKNEYPGVPFVIMSQTEEEVFSGANNDYLDPDEFGFYYLHPLKRKEIRDLVSQYNESFHIYDDDVVLSKIVSDLEVLNLHRTPLNCITLLKTCENSFEDSPVNRTELIRQVLFLLFNTDNIPRYKRRPDLKDCEHAIGWFCEGMLRKNELFFSRDDFLKRLKKYCEDSVIDIDVSVLFDVLYENNIIVERGRDFGFKFKYWVMYFAAQRMHHSKDFAEYIFEDMRYASYPELIEFYTGIDRRRNDAVEVVYNDLLDVLKNVKERCGFPEKIDIYSRVRWEPDPEVAEEVHSSFEKDVEHSSLPQAIKDEYADKNYDPIKPFDQSIEHVAKEYLVDLLMQITSAASRALRNSDYACPNKKKELLGLVVESWGVMSTVLLALAPILARMGRAEFMGVNFRLVGRFGNEPKERFETVLRVIPENVVQIYSSDIFSQKMGPLLFGYLDSEEDDLLKHFIALLLVERRPRGWKGRISNYISSINKNSFYLYNIDKNLTFEKRYGFIDKRSGEDILYLRKMAWAKHVKGAKKPSKKLIDKVQIK